MLLREYEVSPGSLHALTDPTHHYVFQWSLPEDSIHRDGIKNAPSPFALSLPDKLHLDLRKREDARS
jgi:hypothetical protein